MDRQFNLDNDCNFDMPCEKLTKQEFILRTCIFLVLLLDDDDITEYHHKTKALKIIKDADYGS